MKLRRAYGCLLTARELSDARAALGYIAFFLAPKDGLSSCAMQAMIAVGEGSFSSSAS